MVLKRSQWNKIPNNNDQTPGLHFWTALMICVAMFFSNPVTSAAQLAENGTNEIFEFFFKVNKTPVEFHTLIERLEYSNNTKLFSAVDEDGETVLHKAVQQFPVLNETLDILKARQIDFNAVDDLGNSVFFKAVEYGRNASILATLISYGMEWKTKNENSDTALHVAALYGNWGAVHLLLEMGSKVNAENVDRRTPLHQSVLSTNISETNFDIVRELVNSGANTRAIDIYRKSALHLIASECSSDLIVVEIIRFLIENRAETDAGDEDGNTFLHHVAEKCTPAVLHKTVEYLDSTNNTRSFFIPNKIQDQTVLQLAVYRKEVQNETLQIFKKRGVDFNAIEKSWDIEVFRKTVLFYAISGGRSDSFLKTLIELGADWQPDNYMKITALHFAAQWGNLDAVKLFIELGADVNALNRDQDTPLHLVFRNNETIPKLEIVRELVNHGALCNIQTAGGDFPLYLAQQKIKVGGKLEDGIVEFLENVVLNRIEILPGPSNTSVKLVAQFNEIAGQRPPGWNPYKISEDIFDMLKEVVRKQDLNTIKTVFDHVGKSRDVTEILGRRPFGGRDSLLHVAINYRDYSIVEYLLNNQGFSKIFKNRDLKTDLVQLILKNIEGMGPAKLEEKLKIFQLFLSIQPDVTETMVALNQYGESGTILHYFTSRVFTNGKELELVQMLIDNNAKVNATTLPDKKTALHLAVESNPSGIGLMQVIRVLIENQVDTTAVNSRGSTFLHSAALHSNPVVLHEIVEYLDSTNNTNSITIENKQGETALHNAVEKMEVEKETMQIFCKLGVDFDALNSNGDSIFSRAISKGRSGLLLRNMISVGADWRLKYYEHNTALHIAAREGNFEAVQLFLQLGADANARNKEGNTPLNEAFKNHYGYTKLDLVRELINQGANINISNNKGELAIVLAREKVKKNDWRMENGIIQFLENTQIRVHQVSK